MAQIARHCPDCDVEQPFDQVHDQPGECPDFPGDQCQEWCCTACGAALLIGTIPVSALPARPLAVAELSGRVA